MTQKRSAALLAAAMGWLENDQELANLLGADGDVVPVAIAKETEADPRVSVGVSSTSSERANLQEEKTLEVRVVVDATRDWVTKGDGSILELMQIKDRVVDVVATHSDGWGATGLEADEEIAWSDDLNRYLGVVSCGFERTDPHDAHS